MTVLKDNWLTDGLIDFEYKKYILLSYLKDVKENFDLQKLYPSLSNLIFHYNNLKSIKDNKALLQENFPKSVSKADFEKLKLSYELIVKDDDLMKEIEDIISYSLPKLHVAVNDGKDLYEYLESQVEITPVGVTPIYANEGYLMITQKSHKALSIFQYQISVFEHHSEKYRGIHTHFLKKEQKGIGRTYEQMKLDLIRTHKSLPNPATYLVLANVSMPFAETLMPVAKRLLVRYISSTE